MECLFNAGVWTTANMGDMQKRIEETGGFFPIPVSQVNLSAGVLVQDLHGKVLELFIQTNEAGIS